MENHLNERLSALLDDELDAAALRDVMGRMREDEELRARWSRYQLMSDVLQGHRFVPQADRLHERVARALENEPVVLAPKSGKGISVLKKQLLGAAIAASVAAVAILVVQQPPDSTLPATETRMAQPFASAPPVQGTQGPSSVARLASTGQAAAVTRGTSGTMQWERLNSYLVNHNEYSATTGMQGALPYVRIVGHEMEK